MPEDDIRLFYTGHSGCIPRPACKKHSPPLPCLQPARLNSIPSQDPDLPRKERTEQHYFGMSSSVSLSTRSLIQEFTKSLPAIQLFQVQAPQQLSSKTTTFATKVSFSEICPLPCFLSPQFPDDHQRIGTQ